MIKHAKNLTPGDRLLHPTLGKCTVIAVRPFLTDATAIAVLSDNNQFRNWVNLSNRTIPVFSHRNTISL